MSLPLYDHDVTRPGKLVITAVRGVGLKNMETFGKQDPYLLVFYGKVKHRSRTHESAGKAPVWNQKLPTIDCDGKQQSFRIEAWDDDIGSDDFIGGATVDIGSVIRANNQEVTIPIFDKSGKKKHGDIVLRGYYRTIRPGVLTINLQSATKLPNRDIGKQDPYVKFWFDGNERNQQKSKTHNRGGENPKWNQQLQFKLTGMENNLMIEIWDEDIGLDDYIAQCALDIDTLKRAVNQPQNVTLTDRYRKPIKGQIQFTVLGFQQ